MSEHNPRMTQLTHVCTTRVGSGCDLCICIESEKKRNENEKREDRER